MPQFDLEVFSHQIFWLSLCFTVVYIVAHKIFLPKMRIIETDRINNINSNKNIVNSLELEITKLNEESKLLRNDALTKYKESISTTLTKCTLSEEKAISKSKAEVEKIFHDSRKKIEEFKVHNQQNKARLIKDVSAMLTSKVFAIDINQSINK